MKMLHPRSVVPVKIGDAMLALGPDISSSIGAMACTLGNIGPWLGSVGPIDDISAVHPVGTWVLSRLMMDGRLEIFPVVILFRRGFRRRTGARLCSRTLDARE